VLTTIAVPTLLIYGDADVRSPADVVGREMHALVPGSTLVVIPDAPHMVNLEQPEALNTAIRRFACED
jgi:pimeloyl-ACP methyl ester carboxylesterase